MDQNILKDTVPPKNIEAEQAVLGALLLNWSEAIADVVSYLRPDRFYSVQNQVIFDAMLKLYEAQVAELNVSVVAQTVEGEAKAEPAKAKKETKEEVKAEEKAE